jgi:hypothetical protein
MVARTLKLASKHGEMKPGEIKAAMGVTVDDAETALAKAVSQEDHMSLGPLCKVGW